MVDPDANLDAAEKVAELLSRHKVDAVVIGAVALAAYRYIRQTDDIDLDMNADVPTLRRIFTSLHEAGFAAVLREPDGDDPLGGVIDVTGSFGSRIPGVSCHRFSRGCRAETLPVCRPGPPVSAARADWGEPLVGQPR
jgi:hypothetical protein